LAKIVKSTQFEALCSLVIMTYSVLLLVAADYMVGELTDQPTPAMVHLENICFVFFCSEVVLRIAVHRLFYFCNDDMVWNILDFCLVLFSVYENIMSLAMTEGTSINLTFMRSMRLMRMARALRVLKMMRFVSELRFMINSVMGSFVSLFWCEVMLVVMFFLFSLALVQGVGSYLIQAREDGSLTDLAQEQLLEWFGSVGTSMLTCFRVITGGDDWGTYYDLLRPTGVVNSLIFIFFIMFSEIALLNIVTSIFVDNAMKIGQPELAALAFEQRKRDLVDAASLRELFNQIDLDQSGTITAQEWTDRLQYDDKLKYGLAVMGLDIKDASMFFSMLMGIDDNVDIDVDFFVDACLRMKGQASSIDLHCLAYETRIIRQALRRVENESHAVLGLVKGVLIDGEGSSGDGAAAARAAQRPGAAGAEIAQRAAGSAL